MKKYSLIIGLFLLSVFLNAQPACQNINLVVDYSHYTVSGSNHDSTFVKYIQFDLSDTNSVSKIHYTFSNLASAASPIQQDYNFNSISSVQDLTVATSCVRNQKNIKISLGYFQYLETAYLVNLKLYDSNNNLLSSTNFNFNH